MVDLSDDGSKKLKIAVHSKSKVFIMKTAFLLESI